MHCLEVPTVPFRLSMVVVVVSIVVVIIIVSCAIVEVGVVFVMILVKNVPLAIVFVVEAISSDYSTYATYRLSDLCPRRWRLVYLEHTKKMWVSLWCIARRTRACSYTLT